MKKIKLDEINNAVGYLIENSSITGEILTLDSGKVLDGQIQSLKNLEMIN